MRAALRMCLEISKVRIGDGDRSSDKYVVGNVDTNNLSGDTEDGLALFSHFNTTIQHTETIQTHFS